MDHASHLQVCLVYQKQAELLQEANQNRSPLQTESMETLGLKGRQNRVEPRKTT